MADFFISSKTDTRILDLLIKQSPGEVEDAVEVTAFNVTRNAQRIIRQKGIIDTGALLNSVDVRQENLLEQFERVVGPTVAYAPIQEFGSSSQAARPFMMPAAEMERQPFTDAIHAIYGKRR